MKAVATIALEETITAVAAQPLLGSEVQVEQVSMAYMRGSQRVPVLDRVNLEIRSGEFVALVGPSGSGKTTLLNLIAGLDRPVSGTIVTANTDLGSLSDGELAKWRSRTIGFVFQMYHLIPVLTAFENVELPLLLRPLSRKQRREHTMAALELVGLSDRSSHYPSQLSGGQEQRVAIARAIITDPEIIVADEPTGDLDSKSADEILNLITILNRDFHKTVIMVTHDLRAADRAHTQRRLEKGVLTD
jgi:putative ABC transport system ATP-binding protein